MAGGRLLELGFKREEERYEERLEGEGRCRTGGEVKESIDDILA